MAQTYCELSIARLAKALLARKATLYGEWVPFPENKPVVFPGLIQWSQLVLKKWCHTQGSALVSMVGSEAVGSNGS